MITDQIQIITTPGALQEYINNSVKEAFDRLIQPGSNNTNNEQPITTKEICNFLGITEPTIIRWRKKGKIPFLQVGSRILYQKSAVLKALENKKGANNVLR